MLINDDFDNFRHYDDLETGIFIPEDNKLIFLGYFLNQMFNCEPKLCLFTIENNIITMVQMVGEKLKYIK